jgi:hypothetical protein
MGSRPNRVGQIGSLLLLVTLLQGSSAWAQGTVCHRVWVEVRDNDLMGNSEMTAPPRTRYPGKFCFIVYDRKTARFSLEPDDPTGSWPTSALHQRGGAPPPAANRITKVPRRRITGRLLCRTSRRPRRREVDGLHALEGGSSSLLGLLVTLLLGSTAWARELSVTASGWSGTTI